MGRGFGYREVNGPLPSGSKRPGETADYSPPAKRLRRREAAFGHVATRNRPLVPSLERCGYQRRYPRCEPIETTDPIGGPQWNTLGGNSENFIRPLTCRRACTRCSPRSVGGRKQCTEIADTRIKTRQNKKPRPRAGAFLGLVGLFRTDMARGVVKFFQFRKRFRFYCAGTQSRHSRT
jgi:hypothetical protein